jgi:phage tail-like protein
MQRNEIERLLPEVFRATLADSLPLAAVLDVMVGLHRPDEQVLDGLDGYFDPSRTDDRFVPLLARWVDLERLFVQSATGRADPGEHEPISTGHGRLRELISRAAFLSQWRGTRTGLVAFLETATGASGFAIDEQVPGEANRPRPFHIRVRVPAGQEPHRALIERIVELEKPAYVTYELAFAPSGSTP